MPVDDPVLIEAWARLTSLFLSRRDALFAVLAEYELAPPHGHTLISLLHDGPTRMRDMAQSMACDASYVTAVADRLEELGLAERRASGTDRRAKELILTQKGTRAARRLDAVFASPPEALGRLSASERSTLARITRKLADEADPSKVLPPLKLH